VTVVGPIEIVLHVSSSAPDTDFAVKLIDVYPDGTAYNLYDDILRARYREGFDRQVFMEEGEVYRLRFDQMVTGNHFAKDHRIRIEVTSSNFPSFERNLNTGGNNYDETEWEIATNSVHHSKEHPSFIVLPVVETGE
jgi:putative CocE/NonD family hydrolase